MSAHREPSRSALGRVVNEFEESAIALLLGLMTIVTFVNVVLRYVFNASLIWGLEVTLILFAWLVIFGVSYCIKVTAHLGVDAVTNLFSPRGRKVLALISAACCIAYGVLLLKGAWDYWAPFAALQPTEGRWFPLGFTTGVRDRAFYTTDQVPMPEIFRWLEPLINYGDEYEKLPRVIPYAILPVGAALILFRFIQATVGIVNGTRSSMIASHEAEDAIEELAAARAGKD
ncbi:TRAP transporter small permease [Chachezhania sediminis]|uniref:TRAP transporter small permease n=1 Tax=Chachezhania sediminis TaxID=2599291 RepID=UPI00131BF66C|nr:TRAP transporter small permease [Chachezhania sediminis]